MTFFVCEDFLLCEELFRWVKTFIEGRFFIEKLLRYFEVTVCSNSLCAKMAYDGKSNLPRLEGSENFGPWRYVIKSQLKGAGLWAVVNGDKTRPESGDDAIQKWGDMDQKASSLMIPTLGMQLISHVQGCKTAKQLFDKLKDMYSDSSEWNWEATANAFFEQRIS